MHSFPTRKISRVALERTSRSCSPRRQADQYRLRAERCSASFGTTTGKPGRGNSSRTGAINSSGSTLKPYEKFAEMIDAHWDGIAAYCKPENKVPLGFVEGLNNKIRVIQRRAYGLRNEDASTWSPLAACCRKSKNLSLRTSRRQRRDAEIPATIRDTSHGGPSSLPEPTPVKSEAAGGSGLKGQTLQA